MCLGSGEVRYFIMINRLNYKESLRLFFIISMLTVMGLFSSINTHAQLNIPFPAYSYFSPFTLSNPFSLASIPLSAPFALPFIPPLGPTVVPTASIQGSTIYIPTSITTFGINIPGLGPQLDNLLAPAIIFIYPSGYVPPAPIVPVIPTVAVPPIIPPTALGLTIPPPTVAAPTVVPTPIVAPTVTPLPPPTAVAPTVDRITPTFIPITVIDPLAIPLPPIAPINAIPVTATNPASASGLLLSFSYSSLFGYPL